MSKAACVFTVVMSLVVAAPASGLGFSQEFCGNGASSLIAGSNGAGELLVAWGQTEGPSEGRLCNHAVSEAAIGSPATGFTPLGIVPSGGGLSFPVGVHIDDAGDAWVVGMHAELEPSDKYGPSYGASGSWLSFRPANKGFEGPLELPTRHGESEAVLISGNRHGVALVAWETYRGTYLAWATGGRLARVTFFGAEFHVAEMGLDEAGRALVVGYYPGRGDAEGESAIAVVTTAASGDFGRPRVIARRSRRSFGKRRFTESLGVPVVGVGPRGDAFIAYETNWIWEGKWARQEFAGANMLAHRRAGGRLSRPKAFAKGFLEFATGAAPTDGGAPEPQTVTVDSAGRAAIVSVRNSHVEEIFLSSSAHTERRDRLGGPKPDAITVAGNANGQTVLGWTAGVSNLTTVLGDTRGHHRRARATTPPLQIYSGDGPVPTIDDRGTADLVWIEGTAGNNVVNARALTPGATTVQIHRTNPAP
jgi:hypothetical protein